MRNRRCRSSHCAVAQHRTPRAQIQGSKQAARGVASGNAGMRFAAGTRRGARLRWIKPPRASAAARALAGRADAGPRSWAVETTMCVGGVK
jgi:hypothetical protein